MQVDISKLNITRQELSTYIKFVSGSKPDRLSSIQVAWHVDDLLDRVMTIYTGKNKSFTVSVMRHPTETTQTMAAWIDQQPMDVALWDLHRMLVFGLAQYHHAVMNELAARPRGIVERVTFS